MNEESHYHKSKIIKTINIRVDKSDSSFVYFIFESNENLAFYSTLSESLAKSYRDVEINTTPEFYSEVKLLLENLTKKFPVEILSETQTSDL